MSVPDHTQLACYVAVVGKELTVILGVVAPVTAVSPVNRNDNHSVGVGTISTDVLYPLFHVGTECLDACAWQ